MVKPSAVQDSANRVLFSAMEIISPMASAGIPIAFNNQTLYDTGSKNISLVTVVQKYLNRLKVDAKIERRTFEVYNQFYKKSKVLISGLLVHVYVQVLKLF